MKTVNQLIDLIDNTPESGMNETLFEVRENLKFVKRTVVMGGFAQVIETDKIEALIDISKAISTETAVVKFDHYKGFTLATETAVLF